MGKMKDAFTHWGRVGDYADDELYRSRDASVDDDRLGRRGIKGRTSLSGDHQRGNGTAHNRGPRHVKRGKENGMEKSKMWEKVVSTWAVLTMPQRGVLSRCGIDPDAATVIAGDVIPGDQRALIWSIDLDGDPVEGWWIRGASLEEVSWTWL